jgi:Xaa-Pro aminopeptidase
MTADRFLGRRTALAGRIREGSLPALLVTDPLHVSYLTGFSGEASPLLVPAATTGSEADRSVILSDGRFTLQIAEECPGLSAAFRTASEQMPALVSRELAGRGLTTVGFEPAGLTVADLERYRGTCPGVEFVPVPAWIAGMRRVKDSAELAALRSAITMAERAIEDLRPTIGPNDSEKDLADRLDGFLRLHGARKSAFDPIVAAGPRAALPHAVPQPRRPIGGTGVLLVDWGARENFYHSDLTRVFLRGPIEDEVRRVYEACQAAQATAFEVIRPGVTGHEVDRAVRATLERFGYEKNFTHGLGHGLGLQVHEAPFMRTTGTDTLDVGCVVTVEPGIYLDGRFGVRLEDDVLVTESGCERLSSLPLELDAWRLPG